MECYIKSFHSGAEAHKGKYFGKKCSGLYSRLFDILHYHVLKKLEFNSIRILQSYSLALSTKLGHILL